MIISGTVIQGSGIGKKLGLPPTMNLSPRRLPKSFAFGIYAVRVKTPVGEFFGALHYGPRPAVHAPLSFEVHAIGLKKKLYGERISVEIVERIREVKKFASVPELKKAILEDIARAKDLLTNHYLEV